ncbi:DUF445 domain-containing protein [Peribacillus kribbensis]|uniref:DUF445 domain-containing protein n=1 Tax=Peribacillus kribbensis TaxID=356658 RepID=UPI000403752A|nr:DUF445 domain-containing protein [Peribacillus kribbensis]
MFKSSRYLARLSLLIMGIGFIVTIPFQDYLIMRLLQGGFEAGIVGGLADWFAVTALFRHPLGLPIPHTALLPKNRDRMVNALVSALENNWLTKESIIEKIQQISIIRKVLGFVENRLYSDGVKKGIKSVGGYALNQVHPEDLTPFIERKMKEYLSSVQLQPVLSSVVESTVSRKYDEKLLDKLIGAGENWLHTHNRSTQLGRMALHALDQMEFDGFLQFAIKSFRSVMSEEKLGNIIQSLLAGGIESLKREDNSNRQTLLAYIRRELKGLTENEKLLSEAEGFKLQLINEWDPHQLISTNLEKLIAICREKLEDEKLWDQTILPFIHSRINGLQSDEQKIEALEQFVQGQIAQVIEDNHKKIGKLVQENLDKLDNETLIEIMENNIGKDLQWIRVNGAVCGFIIGLVITIIKMLVS